MKALWTCISLVLLAGSASAQDNPLCPLQAGHTAMNIKLIDESETPHGSAVLVTCHYRKEGGGQVGEIGFQTMCPAGKELIHPGFALNGTSRQQIHLSAMVPSRGAADENFVMVSFYPLIQTQDLDLNVYALCN